MQKPELMPSLKVTDLAAERDSQDGIKGANA